MRYRPPEFSCMKFVARGRNIVQVWTGKYIVITTPAHYFSPKSLKYYFFLLSDSDCRFSTVIILSCDYVYIECDIKNTLIIIIIY